MNSDKNTIICIDITSEKLSMYGRHEIRFDLITLKKILLDNGEKKENLTNRALLNSNKFYYIDTYGNNSEIIYKLLPNYIALGDLNFSKYDTFYTKIYFFI